MELPNEGNAPVELAGYFVGLRLIFTKAGEHHKLEGFFHLVSRDGQWRIEEIYLTTIDSTPRDPWFAFSRDYNKSANEEPANLEAIAKPPKLQNASTGVSPEQIKSNSGPSGHQVQWFENTHLLGPLSGMLTECFLSTGEGK